MKFKVGDRVQVKNLPNAKIGTVSAIDSDDDEFPVEVEYVGAEHDMTEIYAEESLVWA